MFKAHFDVKLLKSFIPPHNGDVQLRPFTRSLSHSTITSHPATDVGVKLCPITHSPTHLLTHSTITSHPVTDVGVKLHRITHLLTHSLSHSVTYSLNHHLTSYDGCWLEAPINNSMTHSVTNSRTQPSLHILRQMLA